MKDTRERALNGVFEHVMAMPICMASSMQLLAMASLSTMKRVSGDRDEPIEAGEHLRGGRIDIHQDRLRRDQFQPAAESAQIG